MFKVWNVSHCWFMANSQAKTSCGHVKVPGTVTAKDKCIENTLAILLLFSENIICCLKALFWNRFI